MDKTFWIYCTKKILHELVNDDSVSVWCFLLRSGSDLFEKLQPGFKGKKRRLPENGSGAYIVRLHNSNKKVSIS